MRADRVDVLVVGAGPVGLTLACHLQRLGVSVRVIDKKAGPSVTSKAIGLQYRVSEVLARLGVVDRFVALGTSPTVVNISDARRLLLKLRFEAPRNVSGYGAFQPRAILIPQAQTERLLADVLAEGGGGVDWTTELLGYTQDERGVVARVQDAGGSEQACEAAWLVSCEGAHSVVRKQEGIAFEGKSYPLAFIMADLPLESAVSHDESHVWLHAEGSFAALPLPGPKLWRLFIEMPKTTDTGAGVITMPLIESLMRQRAASFQATVAGEPLWISEFRINARMVHRMRAGRTFLAGDAAHIHSPTGGQGITTGLQDAANLAWKLACVIDGAPAGLLDTYTDERVPHAAEVLRETDRTTNVLFAPTPALRLVRDYLMLPVLRTRLAQRRMFGKFSQLHVHYRGSRLSKESWNAGSRRRIRAGDRAPDVAFLRNGQATTLFQLSQHLRPIVLVGAATSGSGLGHALQALAIDMFVVREPQTPAAESRYELLDRYGDFASLYGLTGDYLCLVRPDGHVGLLQRPVDRRDLADYLSQLRPATRVADAFGLPV